MADTREFAATRRQIIDRHPLVDYLRTRGLALRKDGPRYRCLCPLHKEDSPSFVIGPDMTLWKCFGCQDGGSVIDLHAKLNSMTVGEAMRDLWPTDQETASAPRMPRYFSTPNATQGDNYDPFEDDCSGNGNGDTAKSNASEPGRNVFEAKSNAEVAAYDYHDPTGLVIYQVVRFEPKDFRQCRIVDGKRVWSMEGVERLPYRLPELLARPMSVCICEGEKDVEVLRAIGQTATCNPGGAGKWLPAFSLHLKDQCVYICPDRDEPGQKHGKLVLQSLAGICQWAKWVDLPAEWHGKPIKDVADLREASKSEDDFIDILGRLQQQARLIERGIDGHGMTELELENEYIAENSNWREVSLELSRWVPALGVRPLGPGDLLGIVAGTGQLKTAIVQNILAANPELPGIFFQLELSASAMFERNISISMGIPACEVQQIYQAGGRIDDWMARSKFKNILTSTVMMTMPQVDEEIARSSAKLGRIPRVFVIDYVQLVRGVGSRYDRVSDACEEAKRIAKKWRMIGIIVSQIARKKDGETTEEEIREIFLHDAKGSGSFENSCSLVLGFWRTDDDEMKCRILKNTRGASGKLLTMKVRPESYIIEPL